MRSLKFLRRVAGAALLAAVLVALAPPARAQAPPAWQVGEYTLKWRHTGLASTFFGSANVFPAYATDGTVATWYSDSSFIAHYYWLAHADTSVAFTVGGMGGNALEDWVGIRPQVTSAAADSVWLFTLCFQGARSTGGSGTTVTPVPVVLCSFGDSLKYTLQASYDGGANWSSVETNGTLSAVVQPCSFPYNNLVFGNTYPVATLSRLNFWIAGNPILRVITVYEDWNGAAQVVAKYPKLVRANKGT